MCENPGWIAIWIGSDLVIFPFIYSLLGGKIAKLLDTNIALTTLKNCTKVIVAGIIVILLGILYLMGIISWIISL